MKKKILVIILSIITAISLFSFGFVFVQAEGEVNGWANVNNGKSSLTDNSGDTVISTAGNTAFGSSLVLNNTLTASIYGAYDMSFTLDANLSKGEEVWISPIGIYGEDTALRTGLHFTNNTWMNIALYGSLDGVDHGYSLVVNSDESFPILTEDVAVKISFNYNENGHTTETLYLNGKFVLTADLTNLYGYYYTHTDSIGFDFYNNSEDVKVFNVKATVSETEVNFRKTSINDFVYYGKTTEFTAQRLTTTIDTENTVFAYSLSEQMNAGMFSNEKSHNYEASAEIKNITAKIGAYDFGFYAWYKNVDNYILLKTDGAKFILEVKANSVITVNKSIDYVAAVGDKFSLLKRSTSDGLTYLKARLGTAEIVEESVENVFENYYVGLYGKNLCIQFKNISTSSFYVAYDFTEQGDWITSAENIDSWNIEGEYPVLTSTETYVGGDTQNYSIAVTKKVINDPVAEYQFTFNLNFEGNKAYGIVPYYNSDADYVIAGIEIKEGRYRLFINSNEDLISEKTFTADETNVIKVTRNDSKFVVVYGNETLEANADGKTAISEYYGFFAAGNGTATITEKTYEGFISFAEYEENGWTKTSVTKNDIVFGENGVIYINGNYTEAGLKADTEQKLAKIVKQEDFTNDYVISVDLTKSTEPKGQCQRIGVLAWYLDENNYIVIFVDQWTVWEAYQLNCCGIYNGERMTDSLFNEYEWFLGFLDTPGYIDQTFNLKVIKNGQTIKGFINDRLIFNKTFETKYDLSLYDDEKVGLGMFAAGVAAKFENYSVCSMTAEEGIATPSKGNKPLEDPKDKDSEDSSLNVSNKNSDSNENNNANSETGRSNGCKSNLENGSLNICLLMIAGIIIIRKIKNTRIKNE